MTVFNAMIVASLMGLDSRQIRHNLGYLFKTSHNTLLPSYPILLLLKFRPIRCVNASWSHRYFTSMSSSPRPDKINVSILFFLCNTSVIVSRKYLFPVGKIQFVKLIIVGVSRASAVARNSERVNS